MSNDGRSLARMTHSHRGTLVIISSPSGGGKTSICRRLLSRTRRRQGWTFSISYTTRQRRFGERNGREYFFVSEREFSKLVKRSYFAEHFRVHLYNYGTPRARLEAVRRNGGVMLLDVDVKGAVRLKRVYPDAITIFVLPPSVRALKQRLRQRGTETKEQLRVRFENAKVEMKRFHKTFEYVVINHDLEKATRQVLSIVQSHPLRCENIGAEQLRKIIS